jgi:HlyD family secretion protein
LNRAKALVDQLVSGSRPGEIAAGEAAWKAAGVEAGRLKLDFERMTKLNEAGAATTQELDAARAGYEAAIEREHEALERLKLLKEGPRKEEIEQAKGAAGEAQAAYDLTKKGPRQEAIERAKAQLEQSKRGREIAQTRLGWTTIKSPVTGMVLSQNVESGEYVSAGTPVVTVADLTKVWLRGYVSETDLGRVKEGQKVEVTTDTYPGKTYTGTISFISKEAEFTPKSVQTPKERVKLVYRIKVDIDNAARELKPGMPADGLIMLGQ